MTAPPLPGLPSREYPLVQQAAILHEGVVYSLPRPARHHAVLEWMHRTRGITRNGNTTEGFLMSDGEFYRRKPAYLAAEANGQLNRRPDGYQGDELFSEDVW